MKKLMNKKGQLGLDTVKSVITTLLIIAVIGIATILALTSLSNSNIFAENSTGYNTSNSVIGNVSEGVGSFFGSTSTIFAILIAVVVILAIAIIIAVVSRFGGGSSKGL